MRMTPIQSSMVSHHGYDQRTKSMHLTFRDGKTYRYAGVPQETYDALTQAKSFGQHFAAHIRGKYRAVA